MMTIYLVRHGETGENLQRILQGHMPGTLTEKGKEQVRKTAELLAKEGVKYTILVSSDLKRAMDSAQIISDRLNLPIIPMEIFRERDWGKFTGMSIAEAADKYLVNGKWHFPEGTTETEEGIYERACKALVELQKLFAHETIIVVTHGQFARNIIAAHFECSYHEVASFVNAEIRCKFRSQGTAHFGVMVPLISVVGFFISLRWYRSVPKRSLSFFINGDFACMVPSDLSFTNSSFRSSGTACGS